MQLRIHPDIIARFPDTKLGILLLKNTTNPAASPGAQQDLHEITEQVRTSYTLESLLADQRIARWREVYPLFGAKPRDYRSSIESLGRRCVNGKGVPSISTLVDVYNTISLKYLLTAGGEDLDQIQGDIELAFAGANEPAAKLLGDAEAQSPFPGEVIYKDAVGAICRCWNWREADRTKLTNDTKNCVLVLEDISTDTGSLTTALEELETRLLPLCGGTATRFLLDKDHLTCEWK